MSSSESVPIEGLRIWKNPGNGFTICELHYRADPAKRSDLWRQDARRGMPHMEWEREYELSWHTHAGLPVYGDDFQPSVHISSVPIKAEIGLPLLRGWDFGLTPACIIGQLVGRRLHLLAEVIGENLGATRFVPQVMEACAAAFPGFTSFDFVDPAGFNRSESEETSCVDIMARHGLRPIAGEMTYEKRLGAVVEFLTTFDRGKPLLLVDPSCRVLIEGFRGGYQYPEPSSKRSVIRMDRPLKNSFSHPHDALQYLATRLKSGFQRRAQGTRVGGVVIPMARYSFVEDK